MMALRHHAATVRDPGRPRGSQPLRLRARALASSVAAAAVAAAAVVALVPSGGTASAAGTCSVVAPTKVVLDRPAVDVAYRLAGDCAVAGVTYAAWDVVHPADGPVGALTFEGGATDTWQLEDWMGPGRYTVRPWSAVDVDSVLVVQNPAVTTVKLGSRLTATTTRTSGRLTFSASAKVWSPAAGDWSTRPAVNVSVMHRAPGSDTWTWVKAAPTSSAGRVTLSVVPKDGAYRLMVKETGTSWAGYSSAVAG